VVEDSLKDFFQPEDLDDGRSVFSMYLKEMADIFNHMGYSKYFHTLTKANEYHRCRWPFQWAKTGEEEHGCKCHLTCQNGGELDEESCNIGLTFSLCDLHRRLVPQRRVLGVLVARHSRRLWRGSRLK